MDRKPTYEELEQRVELLEQESIRYKEIENKLSKTLQRLNFHIENSPLAIMEFNNCYQITYWSCQAEKLFGWNAEEVMGKRIDDFQWVHEDDVQRVAKLSSDMLAGKQTSNFHINRNYRKDGSIIICQWCNSALVDTQGKLISVQSLALDLTERVGMEAKLRMSEERFRGFMDNSPGIAWIKDEEGRHVYLSKNYERRFGVKLDDWLGKTDYELWPLETAQEFRKNDLIVLNEDHTVEIVEETQNSDGSTTYWWNFKFPIRDAAGRRYVAGYGIDITERKRIEGELKYHQKNLEIQINEKTAELEERNRYLKSEMEERRKAEEQLEKYAEEITDLYENAPCGYHSLAADGTFLHMNNTGLAWLGYSSDEVIGKMKLTDILTPEGKEAFQRDFPLLKKRGWMRNIEDKWIRKDGSIFDVLVNTTAIFDEKGDYLMNRCSVFDNTKQKRAEEDLRERVKELQCLYSIAGIIEKTDTMSEIYREAVDLMPNGFYYPELACARIIYEDQEFKTENFRETKWKISADIIVHGKIIGLAEVCYLEEMPGRDEGPFLKEERDLINAVTERLGRVTERKRYENDLKKLISEALSEIKTLSGLLPICAECKKIRNDEGYWEQIELYIKQHSQAEFSHSICPDCVKKLYPEFYKA